MDDRASRAATDVLVERRRQIDEEGWTPNHDDGHALGELARAGATYAIMSVSGRNIRGGFAERRANGAGLAVDYLWPWETEWLKLSTPRRDLVKAAALILAEIERLDRISRDADALDGRDDRIEAL